jgi:hypothetical protein
MKKHYLLVIEGDVEPYLIGPYDDTNPRDRVAQAHREKDPEMRDGLFMLDVDLLDTDKPIEVAAYSGWFFTENLEEIT